MDPNAWFTVPMPDDGLPVLGPGSAAEWDAWLSEHHADSAGLWLKIPSKGSGAPGVSYPDALSVALCHGWIDGQKGRLDDDYWLQRFTPRRPGSKWSRINRDQATALIEAGQMRPAGLREVELARADGRWAAAYEPQSTAAVPGISPGPGRQRRGPARSSPPWTGRTGTRSSTGWPTPSGRRPAPGVSLRSWQCLAKARKSIPERRLGPALRDLG